MLNAVKTKQVRQHSWEDKLIIFQRRDLIWNINCFFFTFFLLLKTKFHLCVSQFWQRVADSKCWLLFFPQMLSDLLFYIYIYIHKVTRCKVTYLYKNCFKFIWICFLGQTQLENKGLTYIAKQQCMVDVWVTYKITQQLSLIKHFTRG